MCYIEIKQTIQNGLVRDFMFPGKNGWAIVKIWASLIYMEMEFNLKHLSSLSIEITTLLNSNKIFQKKEVVTLFSVLWYMLKYNKNYIVQVVKVPTFWD